MRRTFVAVLALLLMAARPVPAQTQAASPKAASVADRGVLLKQAADAQQKGDSAQAMRLFQLAADRYQSVHAYLELARLQSRSKETSAALATLTKAREFAPNSEDVLSAYAQLALASKQPMPAVLTLMPLARMYPKVAQYHYLLGVGLMAIGDMPAAVDALEEANRLDPDRALTLLALGLSLNNRKLFAEAKTALGTQPRAAAGQQRSDGGAGGGRSGVGRVRQCDDARASGARARAIKRDSVPRRRARRPGAAELCRGA